MPRPIGEPIAVRYTHVRHPEFDNFPIAVQPLESGVDDSAYSLAAPAVELEQGLQQSSIEDDAALLDKATTLQASLSSELGQLAGGFDEFRLRSLALCARRAENGNPSMLEIAGLKVDSGWITDIVRSMVKDRPVEVEVAASTVPVLQRDQEDFRYVLDYSDVFDGQQPGLAIGSLLRRVGGLDYTRPVVLVEDRLVSSRHFLLNGLHHGMAIRAAYDALLSTGGIRPSDEPGKDFIILPMSRASEHVGAMMETLERTETGMVIRSKDGAAHFRPYPRFAGSIARQYATLPSSPLYRDGVLLQTPDGAPTDAALQAATYLAPINSAFTHVRLHGRPLGRETEFDTTEEQSLSLLLQAIDRVHPDRDHHIYYDSNYMKPAEVAYVLTHMLHHEVGKMVTSLKELSDVRVAMRPSDYFEHNYGGEVWPEDIQGLKILATELPLLLNRGDITSAAIFGYGPFTYSALPIASFLREGTIIDVSDLLPENIELANEWFEGSPGVGSYDMQEAAYERFAQGVISQSQDPSLYADCKERLQSSAHLRVAPMEELADDSVQVLLESFVSCSRRVEKYGFFEAIRQKARILKWDSKSLMVSFHMVKSGGWNNSGDDEGITIPAAKLSIDDIQAGYESAGLEVVRCIPMRSDSAVREDYDGMVAIIARPGRYYRPTYPEGM